jgi:DNA/RNA endonuclease YhcR with UshA esterase domain
VFSTSTTGNQFNVQDATGGILILDTPLTGGPAQGDVVQVQGTLQVSSGELLLRTPTIIKTGTGPLPQPLFLSGAYVVASTATDPLQGMLVRTNNVKVTAVSGTATSTAYNVTVQEPSGGTFTVRVGAAATGIAQTFWVIGSSYDITGTLANFNGSQIKVRSTADVALTATPADVKTIAAAKIAANGETITVEGVVTAGQGGFPNGSIYIDDGTGGLQIFIQAGGPTGISTGDIIRVKGLMATFSGERQIARFSATSQMEVTKLGVGTPPPPRVVTGAELLSRAFEGSLVRLNDVTVTAVSVPSGSGAYNVDVTAPDGAVIRMRVESPAGAVPASTTFTVGSHYDMVGIAAAFNSVEQLKPRGAADIIAR